MVVDELKAIKAIVDADFDQIWSHYSAHIKVRLQEPKKAKSLLRAVHKFGFAASIVSKSIPGQRSKHKRIFLREFASDAIHLMHVLLIGDARGGRFYLRSAVENLWRHVYFKDHPVEYRWLNLDAESYMKIDRLREYCLKTDEIDDRLKESLGRIASGYKRLSRFVHSSKASSLQLQNSLAGIQLSTNALSDMVKDLRLFGRDLVLLPLVLHAVDIAKLHPGEEKFVIDYLDKPRKRLRLRVLS